MGTESRMYSSFWHHWWFFLSGLLLCCVALYFVYTKHRVVMYIHVPAWWELQWYESGSTCRDSPRGKFWYFPLLLLPVQYTPVSGTVMSRVVDLL